LIAAALLIGAGARAFALLLGVGEIIHFIIFKKNKYN
tara:strand:+ start:507 stop:617 length:111 start_codon:yes stop_codon:yes gene_type:complete